MPEPGDDRPSLVATLRRWRAPLVLVPLLVGLCLSGVVGAQLLWAEDQPAAVAGATVTCWDGSESVADECPVPTGLRGLRWTFPSFTPKAPGCRKVTYRDDLASRPLEYSCRLRIEGSTACVAYSERSALGAGLTYFAKQYDGVVAEEVADGTRLVYRDPEPRKNGTYAVTVAYTGYPFAVTVTAHNERLRDAVLEDSVTLRPDRFMRVRPPRPDEP